MGKDGLSPLQILFRSDKYERAGIDVSSRKSTVAVLRPFGEVVKLPFDVRHSAEDLAALAEQLKSIEGETWMVMEHTGRYYESVAKVLHEAGLYVSAVNPLLIKEYGNNSLRKVKTDKADAMKIAKYALDNWAELRDYTPVDTIRYELKTLNRQFQLASKQKTATANNLIALQEQSFPGIRKLFDSPVRSDGTQKWVDFTSWLLARRLRPQRQSERFCRALPQVVQAKPLPIQHGESRRGVHSGKICCCAGAENLRHKNACSGSGESALSNLPQRGNLPQ